MLNLFKIKQETEAATRGVLRNFTKFTGKHLYQSLFFNKVSGLTSATLLKKRLSHRCFPVIFPKFLRTPFLKNTSGRLLLKNSCRNFDFHNINFFCRITNFELVSISNAIGSHDKDVLVALFCYIVVDFLPEKTDFTRINFFVKNMFSRNLQAFNDVVNN